MHYSKGRQVSNEVDEWVTSCCLFIYSHRIEKKAFPIIKPESLLFFRSITEKWFSKNVILFCGWVVLELLYPFQNSQGHIMVIHQTPFQRKTSKKHRISVWNMFEEKVNDVRRHPRLPGAVSKIGQQCPDWPTIKHDIVNDIFTGVQTNFIRISVFMAFSSFV